MFSEVSSCRSQMLCLAPLSLVYATYLPSGVITAWTNPPFTNFSDLKGADRIGAVGTEAVTLLRASHEAVTMDAIIKTDRRACRVRYHASAERACTRRKSR